MKIKPLLTATIVSLSLVLSLLVTSCTPSTTGGGVTSDGYTAPSTMNPVDATERMRSQYRDFR
jgi:hypothetical protein